MIKHLNAFAKKQTKSPVKPKIKKLSSRDLYALYSLVIKDPDLMNEYLNSVFTGRDTWKAEAFQLVISGVRPYYVVKEYETSSPTISRIVSDHYNNILDIYTS